MDIWDVIYIAPGNTVASKMAVPVKAWTIEKATLKARKRLNGTFGRQPLLGSGRDRYQLIGVVTGEARNSG